MKVIHPEGAIKVGKLTDNNAKSVKLPTVEKASNIIGLWIYEADLCCRLAPPGTCRGSRTLQTDQVNEYFGTGGCLYPLSSCGMADL